MAQDILVPNIGDFKSVEIIEVLIQEGQEIEKGDPIIMLESDKSSVEVPSSLSGKIEKIHIKVGDKVSEGSLVASLEGSEQVEKKTDIKKPQATTRENQNLNTAPKEPVSLPSSNIAQINTSSEGGNAASGASPKIMKFARELGVSINEISGSGRKGRVLEQDIKQYVSQNINKSKSSTSSQDSAPRAATSEPLPYQHHEFGEVDIQNIPRIKKLSGPHLVKAWTTIPHVTQHDELDIT